MSVGLQSFRPCFNSPHMAHVAEMEDWEGDIVTVYSVRVFGYISPTVTHAIAMCDEILGFERQ